LETIEVNLSLLFSHIIVEMGHAGVKVVISQTS